jgi:hypothetical protein
MGNNTPATTTQSQTGTSTSNPWAPAAGALTNLVNQYAGMSTAPTGAQTTATGNLVSDANSIPSFMPQATAATGNTFNNAGMLTGGLNQLQGNIGGIASSNPDPMSDPGVAQMMDTLSQNAITGVKGAYAGSGRDPTGAGDFGKTAAIGVMQAQAPVLAAQYQQDVVNKMNAANSLQAATGSTVQGLDANTNAALQQAGYLTPLATAPGQAQVSAANTQYGLPYQNMQQQLAALGMLGGMGGTTDTSQYGTGTQTPANNTMANILGGVSGVASLIGAFGGSDRRLKTDIKKVGETHDNQNIYSYRFKGSNMPQVGMMADEVEKKHPEAVITDPATGYKKVNYNLATRKAATMGMLSKRRAA